MIASTWYCIAQTSTFDTSCSINVTFDGYDIQFSASVKLGISAINITRCTIPDGIIFSIRLRESGSQWFIDLNSNTNISPVVTIADNEYWSIVNKPASEGNIILQLYDITSKYNTSTGGDSLFEIINVGSVDTPRYAVVPKIFQGQNPGVISRTFMTFGGLGTNSGDEEDSQGGVSYLRNLLDVGLADFLEDEDVLTYDKHSNLWVNKKGGFNEEKLQEYLDKHKYITEEYVKDLMELLKWFEFDEINNAVRVKSDFNFIVPNALSFGGLGTDSGDGEAGASYLKNLLDVQLGTILKDGEALVYDKHLGCWVNKAIETGLDLNALQKYLTDNDYITSASLSGLEDQVVQNKADIALLLSWLEYDKVNNAIRVKNGHNFIVDGTLSFGGAGNDDEATQEGLTQVTIQLGDNPNNSYTTENGVIKLPSYPVVPTKVSSFENDAKYITKAELDGIENEFAEIKEDLNALNDLLNDDVAGVINTWDEVVDFLNEYSESQDLASILSQINADIANRVLYEDFEKLEDSVADIAGCFTNGSANNALKLGGQLPSHYATQSALNAAITNITAIGERVTTLEDLGLVRVREGSTYYIKSIYSIVSEGELISGRRASGSSSDVTGGGGISQVTAQMIVDALGYVPYSSQNPSGYITSSALNGYATQSWVEGKKYLTAHQSIYSLTINNSAGTAQVTYTPNSKAASLTLTKAMVGLSNVENTALSTWVGSAKITTLGTITSGTWNGTKIANGYLANSSMTIAGTSVSLGGSITAATLKTNLGLGSLAYKSSLVASDIPSLDWSKITSGKPTTLGGYGITDAYTTTSIDSKLSGYLPLSGGTLTGLTTIKRDAICPLEIENTAATNTLGGAVLRYRYNGSYISAIGAKPDGYLYRYNSNLSSSYKLLDSDNYSSYALPLSGGAISGNIVWGKGKWGVDASVRGVFMSWNDSNYLHITDDGAFYNWNTLIHSGNIGSQSVASANRLLTSSGASMVYQTSAGYLYVGDNIYTSADTHILGNNIRLRYGTSASYGLTLNSSGNVLIGTTTDNGAKLQVNGGITSDSIKLGSYTLEKSTYGMTLSGQYVGLTLKGTNAYNTGVSFADADGVERWVLSYRGVNGGANKDLYIYRTTDNGVTDTVMRLYRASGNVVIGGTADNGAKLQVTGNLTATGEVISTRRATSSDARLKDNINRLLAKDCLAMVRNLQPSSWDWKNDGKHSLGFIAQDVEQYMPYAVTKIKDDKLGEKLNLQYDQFFAPVVGAIQCLDVKVNSHEDEIEGLKKRVKYLENKLQEYGYNRY